MEDRTKQHVTWAIFALFGMIAFYNPNDATVTETVKNAFLLAVGFWLGGSITGSKTASKNADIVAEAARANNTTPDVQPVEVVNDAAKPVPTVEAS